MLYNKIIINTENELKLMEQYFIDHWINRSADPDIKGFYGGETKLWLPGEREPMTYSEMTKKYTPDHIEKHRSNYPYLVYFCADSLRSWLLGNIYLERRDIIEYIKNPLMEYSKNFLDENKRDMFVEYIADEILDYFSDEVVKKVTELGEKILKKIKPYTDSYPYNIFDIDFIGNNIILINKGEIGSYRYKEYLDYVNANKKEEK